MIRRMAIPLFFGLTGAAILFALGTWQLSRWQWKTDLLAGIASRLEQPAVALPANPDPVADKYLQVTASGVIEPTELHVLTSGDLGPGFKVISPMVLEDGRRILIDRGYIGETEKNTPRKGGPATVTGALVWPDETDSFVPAPNLERNIWFARDVELMADTLKTEPVMISVTATDNTGGILPQPVSINISNRHMEYVLTWYSMAIIWIGMTGYAVWRIKRQTK